jgi:hypothetical protein
MLKKGLCLIIGAAWLFCACTDYSQIVITNVKDVKIVPSGGGKFKIMLNARVKNPTCRNVKLRMVELNLQQRGMAFATLTLAEPISIASRSENDYPAVLEAQLQNILAALAGFKNVFIADFTIEGKIKASAFPLCRTIHIKQQPLTEFEKQYGGIVSGLFQ